MAKMTVEAAKKSIIKQIRKHGGLFENCGQKELMRLQEEKGPCDEEFMELNLWVESLDYDTASGYLKQ